MKERRKTHRRNYRKTTGYPMRDGDGILVASDRRRLPTRRLNDIGVTEITCMEFISGMK
jgi:hypothetical protein